MNAARSTALFNGHTLVARREMRTLYLAGSEAYYFRELTVVGAS